MKKLAIILFALMLYFLAAPRYSPAMAALVGHWALDEASGTTAADSSGNGQTLTISGTSVVAGVFGNARNDGGAGYLYRNFATSGVLDIDANPITIEAWIKPTVVNVAWQSILSRGTVSTNGYGLRLVNNQVNCGAQGGGNFSAPTLLTAGVWYHVACVINGASSAIYINGVLDATGTVNVVTSTVNTLYIAAAWSGTAVTDIYNGVIDDIYLYNSDITNGGTFLGQILDDKQNQQSCRPNGSGDDTVYVDCSFAGTIDGVDDGTTGNSNSATLNITSGNMTVLNGDTVAAGKIVLNGTGAITINTGGVLKPGAGLWYLDADGDKWADSLTPTASTTSPGGTYYRKYNSWWVNGLTTADCYPSNGNVFPGQTAFFTTNRGDGSFDYDCSGAITYQYETCSCAACTSNTCPFSCVLNTTTTGYTCGGSINAGPSSCTKGTDIYGNCTSCTNAGTTNYTVGCN